MLALCCAVTVATGSSPVRAEPDDDSTERLYTRGDRAYQDGRFVEAAELWHRALESQPESEETSATRANVLTQLVTAYTDAYAEDRDRRHLTTALEIAGTYERELSQVYGAAWSVPPHVKAAVRDAERLLEQHDRDHPPVDDESKAEPEQTPPAATVSDVPNTMTDPGLHQPLHTPGDGRGLFRGGVATTLVGVGALGPAIWGAAMAMTSAQARRRDASEAYDEGVDSARWSQMDEKGWFDDTHGKVAVVSASAAAALIAAGTVMTILAFRKSRTKAVVGPRYVVVSPEFSGAGLGLSF